MSRKRDLSQLKQPEIESLAFEYLRARIAEFYGEHAPRLDTLDDCIRVLDEGQRVVPDGEPVYITSPGDFEPDPNHEGTPDTGSSDPGAGTRGDGPDRRGNERFFLDHRQELQRGWNCGDIALGMTRAELVQWLLTNEGDPAVRALMGPEIRTAAATSLLRGDFPDDKATTTDTGQEQSLRQLFKLFDETSEDKVRLEAASKIHHMLDATQTSQSSANQQGLPQAMRTPELRDLLMQYFDSNEAMRPQVSAINDRLGRTAGDRLDGSQLADLFDGDTTQVDRIDGETYAEFRRLLAAFRSADQALQTHVTSPAVYRAYVEQYYGREGWMIYHLDFGAGDRNSTSVIDLAARFRATQVRVWVHERGQFWLHRATEQYGNGVINILYNGYNHFVGLIENRDYVAPDELVDRGTSLS